MSSEISRRAFGRMAVVTGGALVATAGTAK
jgi:hypothetical protein